MRRLKALSDTWPGVPHLSSCTFWLKLASSLNAKRVVALACSLDAHLCLAAGTEGELGSSFRVGVGSGSVLLDVVFSTEQEAAQEEASPLLVFTVSAPSCGPAAQAWLRRMDALHL